MAQKKTALTLALGTAFAASLAASPVLQAADNPFEMDSLKNGYQVAQADKKKDGKCGDGKCGGDMKKKEGACGGDKKKEGACGGDKKKEGACGGDKKKEGACGGDKK
jgi:uncharacterized low-complexity protein